jgi:hypothetical protein
MFEVFDIPGAPDSSYEFVNLYIILKIKGVIILLGKKVNFLGGAC